jgi:aminoglycoside phosphotransferase (APT) family kinase protein
MDHTLTNRRPGRRSVRAVPAAVADITPAWLTAVLREIDVLGEGRVVGVSSEVVGQEFGFTGVIARLRLGYDGDPGAAPPTLIAKLPTAERDLASSYRARQGPSQVARRPMAERAAREIWFYQEIAPYGDLPAPRMYYGAADLDAGRVVLLLEDVAPATQGDVLRGCSADEAAALVRAMAGFHTRWWAHDALPSCAWLPDWGGDPAERQSRYALQAVPFLDTYGPRLPRRVRNLVTDLRTHYAAVLTALSTSPLTLIHADLHLDNVLVHPSGGPRAVTVLDWQTVARGRAAIDLSLFLAGSLTADVRRACEADLLREYHTLLTTRGVTAYTHADLLRDYRLALLWQLAGTVGWLSAVDVASLVGRERQMVERTISEGRLFVALLHHDADQVIR